MDASHPGCWPAKGGVGPSLTDGIKMPSWKSELFTDKPEGPR